MAETAMVSQVQEGGTHRGGWGLPVSQGEALIARVAIGGNVWSPV